MVWLKIAILTIQGSVFLFVLSLGLQATWQDVTSLFRRPKMLVRSLLAMNLVMPIFAAAVASAFHLRPAVKIALVLLSVSPVPPLLPRKQLKMGDPLHYVLGLLTAMSVLSIIVVPVTIEVLGKVFSRDVHIGPATVAMVVVRTVLLPLGLGLLVHSRAPEIAQKFSPALQRLENVFLIAAVLPLLLFAWRPIIGLMGSGTILALVAFLVVGTVVGHWMGGRDPGERTALALATALRHPGLALAIAVPNFPDQRQLVTAAIVLYLLLSVLVLSAYNAWSKRRLAQRVELPPPQRKTA
jgi:BASS family bile acid:Na+ symporter